MSCSEGFLGTPQNMMLVSMVQSSSEKQQERRCTRVKLLLAGRFRTEYQMWPSHKSFVVFVKKRLLEGKKRPNELIISQAFHLFIRLH